MEVEEGSKPIKGYYRRLRGGSLVWIGAVDEEQKMFQITFSQPVPDKPLEDSTQITLQLPREMLDALISTYFEEYTVADCEAVLIQKLSDKRGLGINLVPPEKMPVTPRLG